MLGITSIEETNAKILTYGIVNPPFLNPIPVGGGGDSIAFRASVEITYKGRKSARTDRRGNRGIFSAIPFSREVQHFFRGPLPQS